MFEVKLRKTVLPKSLRGQIAEQIEKARVLPIGADSFEGGLRDPAADDPHRSSSTSSRAPPGRRAP